METTFVNNHEEYDFSNLQTSFSATENELHTLEKCNLFLERAIHHLHILEKNASGEAQLVRILESLNSFIELMVHNYLQTRLEISSSLKNRFQYLLMNLLSICKAMQSAKEKNDLTVLFDLIEHEFISNLTQWKIKIIPQLKNKAV